MHGFSSQTQPADWEHALSRPIQNTRSHTWKRSQLPCCALPKARTFGASKDDPGGNERWISQGHKVAWRPMGVTKAIWLASRTLAAGGAGTDPEGVVGGGGHTLVGGGQWFWVYLLSLGWGWEQGPPVWGSLCNGWFGFGLVLALLKQMR